MVESIVVSNRYIVKTPGICGGRARIDGTRIGIETIVGMYRAGASVEEIAAGYRDYDVTPAKVHAALAYYYDHQVEIDTILDGLQEIAPIEHSFSPYITSQEAAVMLGVSHESRRVAQLCRAGKLEGRKMGRDWLVSRESVEAYAQSNRKPGPKSTNS